MGRLNQLRSSYACGMGMSRPLFPRPLDFAVTRVGGGSGPRPVVACRPVRGLVGAGVGGLTWVGPGQVADTCRGLRLSAAVRPETMIPSVLAHVGRGHPPRTVSATLARLPAPGRLTRGGAGARTKNPTALPQGRSVVGFRYSAGPAQPPRGGQRSIGPR